MYSFGNQDDLGEMNMQSIEGDEMGCGFGDDDTDASVLDATYDVDDVSAQMALAIDTDPYAIGQNLGLMGDGGMTDLEDSTELDDAEMQDGGLGGYSGGLDSPAAPPPQGYGYVPAPPRAQASPATAGLRRIGGLHLGVAKAQAHPTFWSWLKGIQLGVRPAPPPRRAVPRHPSHVGPPVVAPHPMAMQHPAAPQPHPAQVNALGLNVSAGGSGGFSSGGWSGSGSASGGFNF